MRIGVAYDEAFNFYYADLFDVLPSLGASVVQFSPVHDRLPDADGFIIGGGYPCLRSGTGGKHRIREAIRDVSKNRYTHLCRVWRAHVSHEPDGYLIKAGRVGRLNSPERCVGCSRAIPGMLARCVVR